MGARLDWLSTILVNAWAEVRHEALMLARYSMPESMAAATKPKRMINKQPGSKLSVIAIPNKKNGVASKQTAATNLAAN